MTADILSLSRSAEGIVLLHMHDHENHNALGVAFVEALLHALASVAADRDAKVCILQGTPHVFSSGGDRSLLLALAQGQIVPSDIMLSRAVLDLPIPVIAAVEGHATGGGLTLALCCDILLLARESRYGCSFMNMGFTPGMGTTRLLADAVGPYIASEMMFAGQFFKGRQLEGKTQINAILPKAEISAKALDIASRIAEKPRFALELLKRDLSKSKRQAFEEARSNEATMHEICFSHPDTLSRIRENYHPG